MIDRLQAVADPETAAAFTIIMNDEIGHVAIGKKWFDYVCGCSGVIRQHLASACRHLFPRATGTAVQYCGAHRRQPLSRILRSDGGAE